jgi:hypothetical protein
MKTRTRVLTLSVLCSALFTGGAFAADPVGEPGRSASGKNPLKNVYFGEQHLHTRNSPDAFAAGSRQT